MRAYNKTGSLSVHAIAGAYVALLGIDMEEAASEGVLGFGIERIEHGHGNSRAWLRALKVISRRARRRRHGFDRAAPNSRIFLGRFYHSLRSRIYLPDRSDARQARGIARL